MQSEEMRVESPAANLVAAWLRKQGAAEACRERTEQQDAAAQAGAALQKLWARQVFEVHVGGAECIVARAVLRHLYIDVAQQLNQVVYVENVRNVLDADRFGSEQRGADYLQRLVFRALRRDASRQPVSALYDE